MHKIYIFIVCLHLYSFDRDHTINIPHPFISIAKHRGIYEQGNGTILFPSPQATLKPQAPHITEPFKNIYYIRIDIYQP